MEIIITANTSQLANYKITLQDFWEDFVGSFDECL